MPDSGEMSELVSEGLALTKGGGHMDRETQVAFTNTMQDLLLAKVGAPKSLVSIAPTSAPQRAESV